MSGRTVGLDKAGCIRVSVIFGHDEHRGWVYYVAADPSTRNSGHGRQIIDAAEAWLREGGVQKVQLMVRETNTKVIAFYEHLGFEVTPRTVMAKWLADTL